MAPSVPEEVDVFSVPHSRMKGLVSGYFDMLKTTNFSDDMDLDALLETLLKTFMEFKTHEQIENRYIMKKLKNKLKKLSIQNTAVCNCHKDDTLGEMMRFIKDGYKKKTAQDRWNYGLRLKQALEDFTQTFLPHMQEEEEVFQPLLLQYFTYQELCDLKKKVIQQHAIQEEVRSMGLEKHVIESAKETFTTSSSSDEDSEKSVEEGASLVTAISASIQWLEEEQSTSTSISDLPPEVLGKVLGYLDDPRDVCRAGRVCVQWAEMARQPGLWRNVLPIQWANGDWSFTDHYVADDDDVDEDLVFAEEEEEYIVIDDDADVDESEPTDEMDNYNLLLQIQHEAKILSGLAKYVLPRVGHGVHKVILANSKAITNGMLNRMLQHCPNVDHLDLTQTRVGDAGLKSLGKSGVGRQLHTLILSGCVGISDATLLRLAIAMSHGNQNDHHRHGNGEEDDDVVVARVGRGGSYDKNRREKEKEKECLCERYYEAYNVKLADDGGCHVQESWNNGKCGEFKNGGSCGVTVEEEKDEGNEKGEKKKTVKLDKNEKAIVSDEGICGSAKECCKVGKSDDSVKVECNGPRLCCDQVMGEASGGPLNNDASCDKRKCHNESVSNGANSVIRAGDLGQSGQGDCVGADLGKLSQVDDGSGCNLDSCNCHPSCGPGNKLKSWSSIEDCAQMALKSPERTKPKHGSLGQNRTLTHLDLSGCYQVSDLGLSALSQACRTFPSLRHVDVSGCVRVTGGGGGGLSALVSRCPSLAPADLYYCDNVEDGPYAEQASGCRNVTCGGRRICCRGGQM